MRVERGYFVSSVKKSEDIKIYLTISGISRARISQLPSRVGLDINAKLASEVAISILAEVIADFRSEKSSSLSLIQSLTNEQWKRAIITPTKDHNAIQAAAGKDNLELNDTGIPYSKLHSNQQEALMYLVEQYITNLKEGHSQVKMEEVKAHLKVTWFAWVGNTTKEAVFYYRIHSPLVLIEFDHQEVVRMPENGMLVPLGNIFIPLCEHLMEMIMVRIYCASIGKPIISLKNKKYVHPILKHILAVVTGLLIGSIVNQ